MRTGYENAFKARLNLDLGLGMIRKRRRKSEFTLHNLDFENSRLDNAKPANLWRDKGAGTIINRESAML